MKRVCALIIYFLFVEQTVYAMNYSSYFGDTNFGYNYNRDKYRYNGDQGVSYGGGYVPNQDLSLGRKIFNKEQNDQNEVVLIIPKNLPESEKIYLLQKQLENIYNDVKTVIKKLQDIRNNEDLNFIKQSFKFCDNAIKMLLENNIKAEKNIKEKRV